MTPNPRPDLAALLDDPTTSVAVVGASDDPGKSGARIYRDLKAKGFKVFAVNPGRATVDGDPAYASLDDLPQSPAIVDIVVPPERTLRVLDQAVRLGYRNVWVQPGAADDAVLAALEAGGFNYRNGTCIMVHARAHV